MSTDEQVEMPIVADRSVTVTDKPTLTYVGQPVVGNQITAVPNITAPSANIAYQWLRNGAPIPQATTANYKLTKYDQNCAISCRVSITQKSSNSVLAIYNSVKNYKVPVIKGNPVVGSALTIDVGAWSPVETVLSFQWFNKTGAIADATTNTYTTLSTDVDAEIWCVVKGTFEQFDASVTTASVRIGSGIPQILNRPRIIGVGYVGVKHSIILPTYNIVNPVIAYQWFRKRLGVSSPISGATSSVYTIDAADVGYTVYVQITATNSINSTTSTFETAELPVVDARPVSKTLPTIELIYASDTLQPMLKVTKGTWDTSAVSPVIRHVVTVEQTGQTSTLYNWQYQGNPSYTLEITPAMKLANIVINETGSNSYGDLTVSTVPFLVNILGPLCLVLPKQFVSYNKARTGLVFTADPGAWDPSSNITYSYAWKTLTTVNGNVTETLLGTGKVFEGAITLLTNTSNQQIVVDVTATISSGSTTVRGWNRIFI